MSGSGFTKTRPAFINAWVISQKSIKRAPGYFLIFLPTTPPPLHFHWNSKKGVTLFFFFFLNKIINTNKKQTITAREFQKIVFFRKEFAGGIKGKRFPVEMKGWGG